MTEEGPKKSDSDIKRDVEEELRFDPDLDATDIGVAVKDGVVTLTSFVKSYTEKFEAEAAAKRVAAVVGLANDIAGRLTGARKGRIPILRATPPPRSRQGCLSPLNRSVPSSRTPG